MGLNKVVKLDNNTWSIEELGGMVYAFLLVGRERAVLLDTGFATCDFRKYARELTALPIDVINTHGHLDHVGQNWAFEKVYIHEADLALCGEHSDGAVRLSYLQDLLEEAKVPQGLARSKFVARLLHKFCYIPQKKDLIPIHDGEPFDLGGRTLRVIHTPGHTHGSICVLDVERRWLFTGDTVCDEGVLLHFDHSCSVAVFRESIEKLKAQSGAWDKMWPCHHLKPLDNSFLDAYLACADEILAAGKPDGAAATQYLHQYGRIALSYTADKL
ncbi:MAG: MBL fold metallo-hydrolase [Oscillospiraceae bacterium]|nr:MBL fold metallo-hydrolase [Oscillospiraceae bacterium]